MCKYLFYTYRCVTQKYTFVKYVKYDSFFLNVVLKNFIILCYKLETILFYKYIPEMFVLYFKVDFLTSLSFSISNKCSMMTGTPTSVLPD